MANFVFFQCFFADAMNGNHDLSSDALKIMLTNSAPSGTDTTTTDITEITAENGYSAGGGSVESPTSTQTGGVYSLGKSSVTFNPTGAGFGPFQYAVLYNTENSKLIGYWDTGGPLSPSPPNYFKIIFTDSKIFSVS